MILNFSTSNTKTLLSSRNNVLGVAGLVSGLVLRNANTHFVDEKQMKTNTKYEIIRSEVRVIYKLQITQK